MFVSLPIGWSEGREAAAPPRLAGCGGEGRCWRRQRTAVGAEAEVGGSRPGNNTGELLAALLTPPPCSPSSGSGCSTTSSARHKARADSPQQPDPLIPAWARPFSPPQLWVPTSHHGYHHGAAALPGSDLDGHRRPAADAALRPTPAPPARGQQL